ncbi:MAG: DNA replication/repair protein RecF, partial [Pseudomonadota bacterium]
MTTVFKTRLTRLKLTNFRNYASLDLHIDPETVVFSGQNGAGKTNLLEAISFFSPGRGMRRAQYVDVARASEKGGDGRWAVHGVVETATGPVDIGTGLWGHDGEPERSRRIRIDHDTAKSADELQEHVRVLWLLPSMDGLFTGPASDRRRFTDRLVLAIDPTHGTRVNAFEKAMRNRNRILEEASSNTSWLDAAEHQVAELGVAVAAARRELLTRLVSEIDAAPDGDGSFPRAALALEGSLDDLVANMAATDAEDQYRMRLAENRFRDQRAGRTLEGPHLSDLVVHHEAKAMPARLSSTGEQKALLLGLVLAHARLVARLSGMTPLLLLDEVAAHLDEIRRAALFDTLEDLGCQAFMTGTDL